MVRRSAGQQYNVSQDMIAETISQANHCFTISKHITNQTPKIRLISKEVSIMPEIANAVICSDTGKSLNTTN
jgi:hypothetical protein